MEKKKGERGGRGRGAPLFSLPSSLRPPRSKEGERARGSKAIFLHGRFSREARRRTPASPSRHVVIVPKDDGGRARAERWRGEIEFLMSRSDAIDEKASTIDQVDKHISQGPGRGASFLSLLRVPSSSGAMTGDPNVQSSPRAAEASEGKRKREKVFPRSLAALSTTLFSRPLGLLSFLSFSLSLSLTITPPLPALDNPNTTNSKRSSSASTSTPASASPTPRSSPPAPSTAPTSSRPSRRRRSGGGCSRSSTTCSCASSSRPPPSTC